MGKAVLISIRLEWVKRILAGEKTLEVRKTRPDIDAPFKCYIYCSKNGGWLANQKTFLNGKVVAEFLCDRIEAINPAPGPYGIYDVDDGFVKQTGLVNGALWDYGKGATLYCWHISGLEIYDTPKPLGKFRGLRKTKFGYAPVEIKRPPQSWCYMVESDG